MKKLFAFILFVEIAFFTSPAQSAPSLPASSGDYFQDLGVVNGGIRMVNVTETTCIEAFQKSNDRYRLVYDGWKRRNENVVTEMQNDFESLPKFWATLDPRSAKFSLQNWPLIQKGLKMGDENTKQQLLAQDKKHLRATCDAVASSLADQTRDFDRYYANLLPTIRRGPPVPVAQANSNTTTFVPTITTSRPVNPGDAASSSVPPEK
ncbi:MAG TPA: hypothetical protein VNW52_03280 [Burkholderiaceae bacterium]|jgi:hypothetical protein|nr:hypothetical protein [Burkholderiaceae bacterium]